MIANANVTKILKAPCDKVWAAIKSIGGLERWIPIIATCNIEGDGVGAIRVLELVGGGEMRDRIIEIADRERRLRYDRFQLPFPVTTYLGTVEVRSAGEKRAEISWSIKMDVDAGKKDELLGLIQGAISDGIDGFERELQGS